MTLPKDADVEAAKHVVHARGRQLVVLEHLDHIPALKSGEAYFLVSGRSCDCDTWLGEARRESANDAGWAKRDDNRRKAMEKKGWSRAKIARAMSDISDAREHRTTSRNSRVAVHKDAEIEQWSGILRNLIHDADAEYVGLMMHQYSGAIEAERIETRREAVFPAALDDFLLNIEEDVLYEIRPFELDRERERAG